MRCLHLGDPLRPEASGPEASSPAYPETTCSPAMQMPGDSTSEETVRNVGDEPVACVDNDTQHRETTQIEPTASIEVPFDPASMPGLHREEERLSKCNPDAPVQPTAPTRGDTHEQAENWATPRKDRASPGKVSDLEGPCHQAWDKGISEHSATDKEVNIGLHPMTLDNPIDACHIVNDDPCMRAHPTENPETLGAAPDVAASVSATASGSYWDMMEQSAMAWATSVPELPDMSFNQGVAQDSLVSTLPSSTSLVWDNAAQSTGEDGQQQGTPMVNDDDRNSAATEGSQQVHQNQTKSQVAFESQAVFELKESPVARHSIEETQTGKWCEETLHGVRQPELVEPAHGPSCISAFFCEHPPATCTQHVVDGKQEQIGMSSCEVHELPPEIAPSEETCAFEEPKSDSLRSTASVPLCEPDKTAQDSRSNALSVPRKHDTVGQTTSGHDALHKVSLQPGTGRTCAPPRHRHRWHVVLPGGG